VGQTIKLKVWQQNFQGIFINNYAICWIVSQGKQILKFTITYRKPNKLKHHKADKGLSILIYKKNIF